MFIQTEETPNPATLKFLPGRPVMDSGTAFFETVEMSQRSPLAEALFGVSGVVGVFLGSDFITITKSEEQEWHLLKPALLGTVMEHFTAGRPIFREDDVNASAKENNFDADEEDDEIVSTIKELLDTRIRPHVAMDGGDIVFHRFEDGIVYLHMQGACAGCPSSTMTLKMGIENMLKHYVPEVIEVRPIA